MTVIIREARRDELSAIKQLLDESWKKTYAQFVGAGSVDDALRNRHQLNRMSDELDGTPDLFLVAEAGGVVIGHVFGLVDSDRLYIDRLHVSGAAHRSGAGSALMDAITKAARQRGLKTIALEVMEENAGAVRFYEALGYRAYERREACGATLPSPSLMMKSEL